MKMKFRTVEIEFRNPEWYQDKAVIDTIATSLGSSKSRSSNKICNSALKPFGTRLLIRVFKTLYAIHDDYIDFAYINDDLVLLAQYILVVLKHRVGLNKHKSAFIDRQLNPRNSTINKMLNMESV